MSSRTSRARRVIGMGPSRPAVAGAGDPSAPAASRGEGVAARFRPPDLAGLPACNQEIAAGVSIDLSFPENKIHTIAIGDFRPGVRSRRRRKNLAFLLFCRLSF